MNKERRKELDKAIDLLSKLMGSFDEIKSIVEQAAQEERDYHDAMPENIQSGERGENAGQAADNLEEVQSTLDDFDIDDLIQKLNEAQGD